jgi:hypothetical protein
MSNSLIPVRACLEKEKRLEPRRKGYTPVCIEMNSGQKEKPVCFTVFDTLKGVPVLVKLITVA